MEEDNLTRIAKALERIADTMENAQQREINMFKKLKADESKVLKENARESLKKAHQRSIDKQQRSQKK